jgi:glycosyltransferase involved in cell wall biosynthesis
MNFMIVTDTFPPDINGVARTLQMLARGLARRGHCVNVLTTTDESAAENRAEHVAVKRTWSLPLPGYAGLRMGVTSRRFFRAQMKEQKPNALYVAVETPMGVSAIRAAQRIGIGVVSGFHTNFHSYSSEYRLPLIKNMAMRYLRWVHNHTRRTLTPSETSAKQLRSLGVNNVGVMGRGVDNELFHPDKRDAELRREWGADEDTPVALFVSRIAPEKNLRLAVKAFQRITELNPKARCVFVGDGPKAKWLRAEFPQFIHAGFRTGDDLARHYASADLFVFPSLTETFGNVLTEALACGLVTVSFDYAAAQQLVRDGVNGFTAPVGEEAFFISKVDAALDRWNNTGMRRAAARTVEKLSWNAIVEQFEHELMEVATN